MCNTTWPNGLLIVAFAGEIVYVFAIAKHLLELMFYVSDFME